MLRHTCFPKLSKTSRMWLMPSLFSTVLLEGFHSFLIPLFRSLPIFYVLQDGDDLGPADGFRRKRRVSEMAPTFIWKQGRGSPDDFPRLVAVKIQDRVNHKLWSISPSYVWRHTSLYTAFMFEYMQQKPSSNTTYCTACTVN